MLGKGSVSPVNEGDRFSADVAVATEPPSSPQQLDSSSSENPSREGRKPKRILHFSDGTLEEFSSDDETDDPSGLGEDRLTKTTVNDSQLATVNPATLDWLSWMMYQTSFAGQKALAACDYLGGHLANFFGILSPKYGYEIEQYQRMLAEERERRSKDAEYGAGWTESPGSKDVVSTELKATNSVA